MDIGEVWIFWAGAVRLDAARERKSSWEVWMEEHARATERAPDTPGPGYTWARIHLHGISAPLLLLLLLLFGSVQY